MHIKKGLTRVAAALFALVLLAGSASAHLPVFHPEKLSIPVGEEIKALAGLSEPLIVMAYSREQLLARGYAGNPGVVDMSGTIFYADGSNTYLEPSKFTPVNTVNPANTNPASADADAVRFKIEKSGTAVAALSFNFNSGTRPTVAYGKTLMNRAADGMAAKRLGGDSVLEIVFLDNVSTVRDGDTVRAQVFLRGKPLAGAEVSATYDGAPRHVGSDEPDNNEYLHADTDSEGKVSFVMDRPGTWVIGIEYVDETFDPKNPAYPENKGVRYRGTVLFPVFDKAEEDDSSSGCNFGFGAPLLLAALCLIGTKRR